MAVDGIQKNKKSYIGSMATGAIVGYAAKWAIPLTPQEKDQYYKDELLRIRKETWQARKNEIEAIRAEGFKDLGADEFIKMADSKKLLYKNVIQNKSPNAEAVSRLYSRVNEAAINVRNNGRRLLTLNLKDLRPAISFCVIGTVIGLGFAVICNAINRHKAD